MNIYEQLARARGTFLRIFKEFSWKFYNININVYIEHEDLNCVLVATQCDQLEKRVVSQSDGLSLAVKLVCISLLFHGFFGSR